VAHQFCAEVGFKSGAAGSRKPAFLLLEGVSPIRLDLEVALRRRFPLSQLDRLFPYRSPVDLRKVPWGSYDLVLISCPNSIQHGLEWLKLIKQGQDVCPLVVVLTQKSDAGREALWSGADVHLRIDDPAVDFASSIDMLLEVSRCLRQYPLSLPAWHVLEVIHNGENALIYLAEDRAGRQVAIKRFKFRVTERQMPLMERFLASERTLARLGNRGLVAILDAGTTHQSAYLVMEYVPGDTLRQRLGTEPPPLLQQRLQWFKEIAEALGSVHQMGLLHRDLKVSNILVREDDSLALLDFGMETQLLITASFLQENEIYSTPYYVSPERILGEAAGMPSDLYALGVILYELLTGRKPYDGSCLQELLMEHLVTPIPRLPDEFLAYQPLVDGLLAKFPDDRLQSSAEVLHLLSGVRYD